MDRDPCHDHVHIVDGSCWDTDEILKSKPGIIKASESLSNLVRVQKPARINFPHGTTPKFVLQKEEVAQYPSAMTPNCAA